VLVESYNHEKVARDPDPVARDPEPVARGPGPVARGSEPVARGPEPEPKFLLWLKAGTHIYINVAKPLDYAL
jgi:hypothetical protein